MKSRQANHFSPLHKRINSLEFFGDHAINEVMLDSQNIYISEEVSFSYVEYSFGNKIIVLWFILSFFNKPSLHKPQHWSKANPGFFFLNILFWFSHHSVTHHLFRFQPRTCAMLRVLQKCSMQSLHRPLVLIRANSGFHFFSYFIFSVLTKNTDHLCIDSTSF